MTRSNTPRLARLTLLAALALTMGCKEKAAMPDARPERPAPAVPLAKAQTAAPPETAPNADASLPAMIDPAPAEGKTGIVEREDIMVNGRPSCALTMRYSGAQDQPVTWTGEPCADITIAMLDKGKLAALNRFDRLPAETRDDLARTEGGKALYIEGGASASLYPLNSAGRVYEVPLAD